MGKHKKPRYTNDQIAIIADAGRTNFPVDDACLLAGIALEEFAESADLQNIYRTNQLRTQLEIRKRLVDDAICEGSIKSIKLFLEHFSSATLPDINDMPEDEG